MFQNSLQITRLEYPLVGIVRANQTYFNNIVFAKYIRTLNIIFFFKHTPIWLINFFLSNYEN